MLEATVKEHNSGKWPQDEIIRSNITSKDVLIVSVGGNDIALRPRFKTILNLLALFYLNSNKKLSYDTVDCFGFKHFVSLFRDQVQQYIQSLIQKEKPSVVMVCMIYYPCEFGTGWADRALNALRYNKEPWKLQKVIQTLYYHATSKIEIPGVKVVPVPLYEILDPKSADDYVEKVEPSSKGGKKMAQALVKKFKFALCKESNDSSVTIS